MDFRDVMKSAMEEYREALNRAVNGLTPVELYYQPAPSSNHIAWLAWHIARVEDTWVNRYLAGKEQIWVAGHWHERLGLSADNGGARNTAEDVAAFPRIEMSEIKAYHDAVREAAMPVIDGLSAGDLAASYDERKGWRPVAPTVTWVLGHLVVEESQHVGQIAYLRGILRGLGN